MNKLTEKDVKNLIGAAKASLLNAYAPYSNFKVGAAILTDGGDIFSGCNVENAAGSGICAERTALYSAVAGGHNSFVAIAVISDSDDFCTPCGTCRQALYEFSPEMNVYSCKKDGSYKEFILKDLLPEAFKSN